MKTPKDSPTKPGDRVRQRGSERTGTIKSYVRHPTWFRIAWDDGKGPFICHQNELQLLEPKDDPDTSDIPEVSGTWFRDARGRLMKRFICTPEHPWTPEVSGPGLMVLHPASVVVDEAEVERRCPVCGYEWVRRA